jgi:hypothetical protein
MPDKIETPFDGVIIARDATYAGGSSSSSGETAVHLAIKHEADEHSAEPRILLHQFLINKHGWHPKSLLRVGHKVKVKSAYDRDGYMYAGEITFNPMVLDTHQTAKSEG